MCCRVIKFDLDGYVCRDLTRKRRTRVRAHLRRCHACRQLWKDFILIGKLLKAIELPTADLPAGEKLLSKPLHY